MLKMEKFSVPPGSYGSGDNKCPCVPFSHPLEAFRLVGTAPVQSGIEAAPANITQKLRKTKGEKLKHS